METAATAGSVKLRGLHSCGASSAHCKASRHEGCDLPLIYSTWKQSMWHESDWGRRVTWPVFEPNFHRVIDGLLGESHVVVACAQEDEDHVLGYLVWQDDALIFAYVKDLFRREGIFNRMLRSTSLPRDLAGRKVVCCTRRWFPVTELKNDKLSEVIRKGRGGLGDRFKATYDPFRMFQFQRTRAEIIADNDRLSD